MDLDFLINKIDNLNISINDINMNSKVKQRSVNEKLGRNITKDHTEIYNEIEKKIGKTKRCNFGHIKGSKTNIKHEGCFDVPIRDFELCGAYIENGKVVLKNKDGLQNFCRNCSKHRRQARINNEINNKNNKSPNEIYEMYKIKYGTSLKKCSECNIQKQLNEFYISITMECGIHNKCRECSYNYKLSGGERWIVYLYDGVYKYSKNMKNQSDDHIFPLSLGGTNEKINHQLLDFTENIKKSNDISHFKHIKDIKPELLCERYRNTLKLATDINDLKIKLSKCVYNDILERSKMNDEELTKVYENYCKKYNMRKSIKRAVKKFREYCLIRDIK